MSKTFDGIIYSDDMKEVLGVENKNITSAVIADGATAICGSMYNDYYGAFFNCKSLVSATIPASVTKIGEREFSHCYSLSSVNIPESVTEIGAGAFEHCSSLESVNIPESVKEIGEQAFLGCAIETLSHPCLTIKDGVAVQDGNVYLANYTKIEVTIPDGVTKMLCGQLVQGGFECCQSLKSVTIPDSVTVIGEREFWRCRSLSSVNIPSSVTEIGDKAFWECTALAQITYGGTMEQWKCVKKADWHGEVPATVVKCTDGKVALEQCVPRNVRAL